MNKFELFTMIYYVIDAFYQNDKDIDNRVNSLLADMNPFVWKDNTSADPIIFNEFCSFIGDREITVDSSFKIAKEYIDSIDFVDVTDAIKGMTVDKWVSACNSYLKSDHKGK